jgi:ferritin-like metal-binding protein YciE
VDAALIASAQKVEHYEIASYGCLRTYAELLGFSEAAQLLQQNLQEEEATDKKLTQLGESGINQAAATAGAGIEEE